MVTVHDLFLLIRLCQLPARNFIRIVILGGLLTLCFKSHSQVDLQTGSATYNVNMFNWQDNKSRLKAGVSINYSSGGGLKVNDIASNVGQGWALAAGGVITRMQVGEPDDQQAYGSDANDQDITKYPAGLMYAPVGGSMNGCPNALTRYPIYKGMNQVYAQKNVTAVDRQADYFAFSFNGKSGMFVLGPNGSAWPVGDTRLTISVQTDATMATNNNSGIRTTIKSFTITDDDGLIYKFGFTGSGSALSQVQTYCGLSRVLQTEYCDPDATTPQKQPNFKNGGVYHQAGFINNSYVNPWIIGSWYLAEIDDPFTGRNVSFTYAARTISNAPAGVDISDNYNTQGPKEYIIINHKTSNTLTPEITGITLPDGHSVAFNYATTARVDYPGEYALSSIDIKYTDQGSGGGGLPATRFLSEYQVNTTYFILNRYGTPTTDYQKKVARLCLKSIRKIGVDLKEDNPAYIFDYYLNTGSSGTDDFVPAPFFYAKDIYGYYNGSSSTGYGGNSVPLNVTVNDLNYDQLRGLCFRKTGVSGVVINPKSGYAKNGLLRQIVYPTGGAITYQYAQNLTGTSTLNGGVHVSSTSITDGGYSNGCTNPIVTQYNYVVNGTGSASSLWGVETPANVTSIQSHYAPEHRTFHFSWSCGACCYWHFQYPGIIDQYQSVSLSDFQNFMNAIAPVFTIIDVVTDIMHIATLVGGATGFGAIAAVVIDVVGIIVGIILSCTGSDAKDSSTTIYYNSNLNDISPLPKQFMRVEIIQSPGGIGKTVQVFTNQNDYPLWVASNPSFSAQQRFAPWAYGLPDSTMIYDSIGNLVKKVKNIYNFGLAKHSFSYINGPGTVAHPSLNSCKCQVLLTSSLNSKDWSANSVDGGYTLSSNGNMSVKQYSMYTGRVELDTTYETVYSTTTPSQYIETKTAYQYNSMADTSYWMATPANNYDIKQVASWQSNGDTTYKNITYPGDYYYSNLLNTGLIAHWPLNNTGTDLSGNNHTGTLSNVTPVPDRFGVQNNALLFNGTSSSVTVGDATDLHLYNTDYTISGWVRLDAYNTGLNSAVISRRGNTGSNQGYVWIISGTNSINTGGLGPTTGGNISFNNGAASYTWTSSPIATSQWHFFTVEYSNTSHTIYQYLDGTLYGTQTGVATNPASTTYPLTIGYDQAANISGSGGYYFQGAMSDLRIYNRILATNEIQQLYTSPNPSAPSNPPTGPLYALLQHNIASVPVSTTAWKGKANNQGVIYLSEKVNEFSQLSNGDIKAGRTLEQRFAQPVAAINTYAGPGNTANPTYFQTETYSYNTAGNLVGMQDEGKHVVTSIYDYNDRYVVAAVINADPATDNCAYTSFETPALGGWTLSGVQSYNNSGPAQTGNVSLALLTSGANYLTSGTLNTTKAYTLSFWSTNGNVSVVSGATLAKSGPTYNGFTYYEYNIAQGTSSVKLINNNTASNANIDEVRLYPQTARMRTITYDPLVGKTAECDENNRITYYQYDNLGRLRFVLDETKNVIKMYEYNNVSSTKQTGCPATFYNPVITEIFHRTNCSAGYYGDTVSYTIPANKYSSTISQADADAKAEVDLLLNGPVYANNNAGCRVIYYNVVKSEADSATICGTGQQGKWITYTVPAGTYSSHISQAIADSLAQADVDANAKTFANSDPVSDCTVSTQPDWESSETNPVYYCVGTNEYIQEVDMNPNSPTYNHVQYDSIGVADGSCSTCSFTWNSSITNTITSNTSMSGTSGSFQFVFFPPSVGYSSGTIGQLKGGCVPTSIQTVVVPDAASNGTRTWQVTFYPNGNVNIQLYSGPAPTTTTVPISISGTFGLGSSLDAGMVAHWPLQNSGTDVSGNSHYATLSNTTGTTDHKGVANNAVQFNGTSSVITVGDGSDLHLTSNDYTISAWVKLSAYNTGLNSAIISRRGSTGANQGYLLAVSGVNSINSGGIGPTTGGNIVFNNGAASYAWSSSPVALNQWHMVTIVFNYSMATEQVYLDGVLYNSYTHVATNPDTNYSLTMGYDAAASISGSGGYYFQGAMSDVRLYNRTLTSTEVQQLYNQ